MIGHAGCKSISACKLQHEIAGDFGSTVGKVSDVRCGIEFGVDGNDG